MNSVGRTSIGPDGMQACEFPDATALGGADFVAPRQTLSGPSISRVVGDALRAHGVQPGVVCVIADAAVHDLGIDQSLLEGLTTADLRPEVFANLSAEPSTVELDRVVALARNDDCVAVVGVGGGSAMDAAKLVALALTNSGSVADWAGVVRPPRPIAPLALVPTTVGTGAEATRIAMLTNEGRKQITSCLGFVPLVAALDPELVANLPGQVVAATAMDALAHATEALLSTNRNALTVGMSLRAVELIVGNIDEAVAPDGQVARGKLLLAAHLAGLALNAGVVLGHSLAYLVANRTRLSHGVTCAMSLPYCLVYNKDADREVLDCVSRALTQGASDRLIDAIAIVVDLNARLEMPESLAAVGIDAGEIDPMVSECLDRYPRPNNPVVLEAERLRPLLESMHAGTPSDYLSREARR